MEPPPATPKLVRNPWVIVRGLTFPPLIVELVELIVASLASIEPLIFDVAPVRVAELVEQVAALRLQML